MGQGAFKVTLRSESEWDRETFNASGVKLNGHGLEVGFSLGILCKLTLFWYYRRGNLISAVLGTSRCKQREA